MPTDDERREVAQRLRKAIGLTEFAEVLGFDWTDDSDWVWNDVSNLVADLIEPEPERTCRVKPLGNSYMCLACRAVTDKKAVSGMSSSFCVNYCPNCGAKIVGVKLVGES